MSRCRICSKVLSEYNNLGYCYHHEVRVEFDTAKWFSEILTEVLQEIREPDHKVQYTESAKQPVDNTRDLEDLFENIVAGVGREFEIAPYSIHIATRRSEIVLARQVAMYILREAGCTFPKIAEIFDKDHTTVMHAYNKIESLLKTTSGLEAKIAKVQNDLLKK